MSGKRSTSTLRQKSVYLVIGTLRTDPIFNLPQVLYLQTFKSVFVLRTLETGPLFIYHMKGILGADPIFLFPRLGNNSPLTSFCQRGGSCVPSSAEYK